ncbi:MAG: DUF5716 family protein [Clostridiales bacterium]|jgi:molecular chaperone DnaK (HSP70)|nr:DUF5716 family protein [Clostridiales bacterium]
MNWKRYKSLPAEQKRNEIYYILGLDIGNDSSGIAFYNFSVGAPEVIDLSGGYGRPSVPTVMQYIPETKEWVFGEYAILNRGSGTEITLSALMARLGSHEYVEIDRRPMSVVSVIALFIKELIGNVRNINPKAEIAGIVVAVPSYFSEQAREEYIRAFKLAGYEKELIALVSDRECVFAHYYATHTPREEHTLFIDYGSREVRGGLYHVVPSGREIAIKSMSSLFDESIATAKVNESIRELFLDFYIENTGENPASAEMINAFAYQHKDILFQKNIRSKPVKLYFNFAYPPFQQTVKHAHIEALTAPYLNRFHQFAREVMEKNLYGVQELTFSDISNVICAGGGFEMLWTREAVAHLFKHAQVQFYKNTKIVAAEGAALSAAMLLGAAEGYKIVLEDRHQLSSDIGLVSGKDHFLPLVERNAFWWQNHPVRLILVKDEIKGGMTLTMASRSVDGDITPLGNVLLDNLPARPKGVTRLGAQVSFSSNTDLTARFTDLGFGEMFPGVDYERAVSFNLA